MYLNKYVKMYSLLGKILCGIAGGIVGFFTAGALLIIPGIAIGAFAGHVMKKTLLSHS
jgi:hypothetical protein